MQSVNAKSTLLVCLYCIIKFHHLFTKQFPQLNLDNPIVNTEIFAEFLQIKALYIWLEQLLA
jgi:hypothetical protein